MIIKLPLSQKEIDSINERIDFLLCVTPWTKDFKARLNIKEAINNLRKQLDN